MKNFIKLFWIIAIVAVIGFSSIACDTDSDNNGNSNGNGNGNGANNLSGIITIMPDTNVITGQILSASYRGTETVTYQWKVGSTNLGTGQTQIATQAGSYTVTVNATGFNPKTSTAVVVNEGTAGEDGSEQNPFFLNEGGWKDGELTANINEVWYTFDVTEGVTYNLLCNGKVNAAGGDSTKTADIQFVASYSDGTSIFSRSYVSYTNAKQFTASKSGTVMLKGVPWSAGGTGTFAIGYFVANTAITLNSAIANGSTTQTTTQLTLNFNKAILLSPRDITLTLSGSNWTLGGNHTISASGSTYIVDISEIINTWGSSQTTRTFTITIQKTGYVITGSPKTTTVYTIVPAVPTGVNATALSSSSIRVSWNAVAGATSYIVAIANATQANAGLWNYNSWDRTSETSITYYGLNASETLYFRVKAYNGNFVSTESSTVSATTQSGGGGGTVPSTPAGLNASATSSSSITVSWTASTNATGYRIYRSSSSTGSYTEVGTSTTTSYTNTGLTASTNYYYRVAAFNQLGNSSQSSTVSATTQSAGSGGGSISAPKTPVDFLAYSNSPTNSVVAAVQYQTSDMSTVDNYAYVLYINGQGVFAYVTAPNNQSDSYGTLATSGNTGSYYSIVISDSLTYQTPGTYRVKVRIYSQKTYTVSTPYIETAERTVTVN